MKNRIRDMREDHDLEQKDVAKILGISRQYYSRYELGQIDLPISHYITLAQFYNVSIDYLCGASGTPKPLRSDQDSTHTLTKYDKLIEHYRTRPAMQGAIDKLLDIEDN